MIRFVIASDCEINAKWLALISIVFAPHPLGHEALQIGIDRPRTAEDDRCREADRVSGIIPGRWPSGEVAAAAQRITG
jgi:hypothetical protein